MTDERNKDLLNERITTILTQMDSVQAGSDEHEALKEELNILLKAANDQEKLDMEQTKMIYESTKDTVEEKERTLDRWLRAGIDILKIGVTAAGSIISFRALKIALGYETKGTFTSKAGLEALKRALSGNKLHM